LSILIKNATIPDFQNKKFLTKNIIVKKNRIEDVLPKLNSINENNFTNIIDAKNLIVSPGFIDVHSHSDLAALNKSQINPKIMQGVTTEVVGNCGISVVPVNNKNKTRWRENYLSLWGNPEVKWLWTDTTSYLLALFNKSQINIETLLGYSTLRYYITGLSNISYDSKLFLKMEKIISEELEKGAKGISLGIGYVPNIYASREEYELIFKLARKYDKIVTVHLRNEGDKVIESIKKIISYNKKAKAKLHISHLKCYGKNNWSKTDKLLEYINQLNKKYDITFDSYPYTAGSTTLLALLPPTILDKPVKKIIKLIKQKEIQNYIEKTINEGLENWENYSKIIGFENICVTGLTSKKYKDFEMQSITEISKKLKISPIECICNILIAEKANASMIMFSMSEDSVIKIFKHEKHMVGSDGLYSSKPHPRTYGTFPRVINRFCKELKVFDLITALYQMTKFPAERFNIKNRGEILPGNFADFVIFDYEKIKDTADYSNPKQFPEGIKYIIINGRIINQKKSK